MHGSQQSLPHSPDLNSLRETVPDWTGRVTHLHITPRAFLPMRPCSDLMLLAGRGVEGDRYCLGRETGFYSHNVADSKQITLFEIETLEALKRDYNIDLAPEEHRRNVTVRGVPLNHLVGKRIALGETLLEALMLSVPCRHIEDLTRKQIFNALIHRSGLCCRILRGGTVRVGDEVRPA